MINMINKSILVGRLTKDADLRYTAGGKAVATFTLASNRPYTNQAGEKQADFINCVVWNKSAEALANHTSQGSLIGVVGRIQTRNYENNQGQRVYVTEVLVEEFQFLESKKNNESRREESEINAATVEATQKPEQAKEETVEKENEAIDSSTFPGSSPMSFSDDDFPF